MIIIRKAVPSDGPSIVDFQQKMAQKTYEALGMSSEHYSFYEWMRE